MTRQEFTDRIVRFVTAGCQRPEKAREARLLGDALWATRNPVSVGSDLSGQP